MFSCQECHSSHTSSEALRIHKIRRHGKSKIVSCVRTKKTYTLEEFTRLSALRYKTCGECNKEFWTEELPTRFCSMSCASTSRNKTRTLSVEAKNNVRAAARKTMSLLNAKQKENPKIRTQRLPQRTPKQPQNREPRQPVKHQTRTCIVCDASFMGSIRSNYCSKRCYVTRDRDSRESLPMGGCRERSGRSKYGYYEGIWCQSTYEMAFVWYCKSAEKEIIRNTEGFPYIGPDGKQHLYFPDFIVEGRYKEVKGYLRENDAAKLQGFPHPIDLLIGDEIKTIVRKAKAHFGVSDLSTLYAENKRPTFGQAECGICGEMFEKKEKTSKYCSRTCSGKAVRQINHSRSRTQRELSIPKLGELDTRGKVKAMVLHGNTTSEIAGVLGISTASVSYHRKKLDMLSKWQSGRGSNPHYPR